MAVDPFAPMPAGTAAQRVRELYVALARFVREKTLEIQKTLMTCDDPAKAVAALTQSGDYIKLQHNYRIVKAQLNMERPGTIVDDIPQAIITFPDLP